MKAKEKKDLVLNLLQSTTYNLCDDFSASVRHIKFDGYTKAYDYYSITFYPNKGPIWTMGEVQSIIDVGRAVGCYALFKTCNGVPVIKLNIDD